MNMTTYTGKSFSPLSPSTGDIDIIDIAHALSMMCRGNGQIKYFFSVAQHSINCVAEAQKRGYSQRVQLATLLHDASEAYLSDVIRPVKIHLEKYHEIETMLQNMIYDKYITPPLTDTEKQQVKLIDNAMLMCELVHFFDSIEATTETELLSTPDLQEKAFCEVKEHFLQLFATLLAE